MLLRGSSESSSRWYLAKPLAPNLARTLTNLANTDDMLSAGKRAGVRLSAGGGAVSGRKLVAGLWFTPSKIAGSARCWAAGKPIKGVAESGELGEFSFAQIATTVSTRHRKHIATLQFIRSRFRMNESRN